MSESSRPSELDRLQNPSVLRYKAQISNRGTESTVSVNVDVSTSAVRKAVLVPSCFLPDNWTAQCDLADEQLWMGALRKMLYTMSAMEPPRPARTQDGKQVVEPRRVEEKSQSIAPPDEKDVDLYEGTADLLLDGTVRWKLRRVTEAADGADRSLDEAFLFAQMRMDISRKLADA